MNLKTVLLALLLAVAGLSWIWALQGQRESVRAAEALDEAEEKSRLFRETVRRLAEDEEAQRHARTTATDVLAEWRVLLGDGLLAVLERVESHADRTGIEVDDVVQAPGDKAERLTWNVTGGGGLEELLQFLAALENDPAFSLVTRMVLAPQPGGGLSFDLDVTMFRPDVGRAR